MVSLITSSGVYAFIFSHSNLKPKCILRYYKKRIHHERCDCPSLTWASSEGPQVFPPQPKVPQSQIGIKSILNVLFFVVLLPCKRHYYNLLKKPVITMGIINKSHLLSPWHFLVSLKRYKLLKKSCPKNCIKIFFKKKIWLGFKRISFLFGWKVMVTLKINLKLWAKIIDKNTWIIWSYCRQCECDRILDQRSSGVL